MKKTLIALSLASSLICGTAMAATIQQAAVVAKATDVGFFDQATAKEFAVAKHISADKVRQDGNGRWDVSLGGMQITNADLIAAHALDVGFDNKKAALAYAHSTGCDKGHVKRDDAGNWDVVLHVLALENHQDKE